VSASALPQSSPTKIPILKLQCLLQQGKIVAATGERQNAPRAAIDNGRVECGRFQISLSDDECRGSTCLYRRDTSAKRSRRISYFSSQLVHHRRLGPPRPRGRESQRNQAGAGGPLIVEPEPELKGPVGCPIATGCAAIALRRTRHFHDRTAYSRDESALNPWEPKRARRFPNPDWTVISFTLIRIRQC
jgi:hypothetical protein